MPIYEFKCGKCGARFDFLAKRFSDRPEACPECGASAPVKQLSTFSAHVASGSGTGAAACPAGTCCSTGACSLG